MNNTREVKQAGLVVVRAEGTRWQMANRMWLVTVRAAGPQDLNGASADALLHRSDVGGTVYAHGFGPGSVELQIDVGAPNAAVACRTVHERVGQVLGHDWSVTSVASHPRVADSLTA